MSFTTHTGTIAVLDQADVDTDRIIPARFLSRVTRQGYGELLFKDADEERTALGRSPDATVLVAGANFGCGSSREHAVWAIQQAGFVGVVAPSVSDIFKQNALGCGLLTIELEPQAHQELIQAGPGAEVTIDLPAQTINGHRFEISPAAKNQLMRGLDTIGATLEHEGAIAAHERDAAAAQPSKPVE